MSGGGGGGKYATMAASGGHGFGRYTSVVDRYTPGMVRYGLRSDRTTPSELETAFSSCRTFLLSRLKAAEVLGRRRRDPSSGDALGGGGGGGGGPANQPPPPPPPPPPPIGQYNNVNFAFEQIRTKLLDLIETDITVVRQLLNAGELLEEIKWQRNYGGGGGGGGSTSVDMSLADIESVDLDLDPYMTYLASSNKRLEDDVINADDADDVFQNDDTGGSLTKTTCSVQSNELRLTLTRSGNGVKVNSSDSAGSSKPHLVPGNSRSLNKMTKVEFQVSGLRERGNKSLPKSQNDFTTAKENHETVEMQQEIPGTKDEEKTTQKSTAAPAFLRLVVQRNNESDRNGQQHPSRHEQPQHNNSNNNNSAQLPVGLLSETNRRLNGSNANLRTTLEDAKTHSPSASSAASHQLLPGISQSQIRRQIKTEESKRGEASLDDASTAPSVVITHL